MNRNLKTALAAVLLAGVSTAAVAQDRDHGDRGDRRQGAAAPAAAPMAAPAPAPAAAPARAPQPRSEGFQSPQGGRARFGAPPPSGAAPAPAPAAVTPSAPASPGGQRFNGANGGGERRWDRGQGGQAQPGNPRAFDRSRGPSEVVPPAAGPDRTWDGRRDGRPGGGVVDPRNGRDGARDGRDGRDGRWDGRNGRDGRDGRDGHWDGRNGRDGHDGRWPNGRPADHWQSGRYPSVYWSQDRYRRGAYHAPYGFYVRSWAFGDILPRGWYGPDYFLDDFLDFGLPYPPPGYEWVRVGADAVLIDEYTGRIAQVVRGIFY